MKTLTSQERPRVGRDGSHNAYGQVLTPSLAVAAIVLLALTLMPGRTAAGAQDGTRGGEQDGNFCQLTAEDALLSCRTKALSDYQLALGKCDNIADAARRKACEQQAAADFKDAQRTCGDQNEARLAVCKRLGGAAYDPVINPANFVAEVNNPYFPLKPGTTFIYETSDGRQRDEFFVTHHTKVIQGVTCIEVRDTVTEDGELIEDTLDWYAQDKQGNVWYFGENAKQLQGGLIVGLKGSWVAGEDGAKPGIIMEAHPQVGDFYRQEFSLTVAEDIGEVLSLTASVKVPAGPFPHCLKTKDTSTLEPDVVEYKFYAPKVGNVLETDPSTGERLELIEIKTD